MTPAGHVQLPQRPPICRGQRPRLQLLFPLALFLSSLPQALASLVSLLCLVPTPASSHRSRQRLHQSSPPGLLELSFRARRISQPRYRSRPCRSRVRKAVRLRSRTRQTSCARQTRLHWSPTRQPTELLLQYPLLRFISTSSVAVDVRFVNRQPDWLRSIQGHELALE